MAEMDMHKKLMDLYNEAYDYARHKCDYDGCDQCSAEEKPGLGCFSWLQAQYLIAHGVTVQEWISVDDKLPEECPHPYDDMTKAVLIYTPVDGYTHIGWYAGKDYRGRDVWKTLSAMRSYQTCIKKVSHWCYLPQPPKGE